MDICDEFKDGESIPQSVSKIKKCEVLQQKVKRTFGHEMNQKYTQRNSPGDLDPQIIGIATEYLLDYHIRKNCDNGKIDMDSELDGLRLKKYVNKYMNTEYDLDDRNLFIACLNMAIYNYCRKNDKTHYRDYNITNRDINEMALLYLYIEKEFDNIKSYEINPEFGSDNYFGACGDIILNNNCLIDVKTQNVNKIDLETYTQLVCYLVIFDIIKQKDMGSKNPERNYHMKNFGIYFARHGETKFIDADSVYKNDRYKEFREWFKTCIYTSE